MAKVKTKILYHVGARPPHPCPHRRFKEWERPWLKEPLSEVVFLTPDPVLVADKHGRYGNVYAYRVPIKVIKESGGIHRFDNASEVIIPKHLWPQVKFLGKSYGADELGKLVGRRLSITKTVIDIKELLGEEEAEEEINFIKRVREDYKIWKNTNPLTGKKK